MKSWERMSPAERLEAVRPFEAAGDAPGTIAWKLKAPKATIGRICVELRRAREDQEIPAGSHGAAAGLPGALGDAQASLPAQQQDVEGPEGGTTGLDDAPAPETAAVASAADHPLPDPHAQEVDGGRPQPSSDDAGAKSDGGTAIAGQEGDKPGTVHGQSEQQDASASQVRNEPESESGAAAIPPPVPVEPGPSPMRKVIDPAPSIETPMPGEPEPPAGKTWSELTAREKDAEVRDRTLAGQSYRQIADAFGVSNRASVASVVSRLRTLGELPPARSRRETGAMSGLIGKLKAKARREATVAVPRPKAAGPSATNIAVRLQHRAEAPGIVLRREFAFDPIPGTTPVPFGSAGCKWAVDGTNGRGMLWCGSTRDTTERADEPYCRSHAALAYSAPTTRQKAGLRSAERIA